MEIGFARDNVSSQKQHNYFFFFQGVAIKLQGFLRQTSNRNGGVLTLVSESIRCNLAFFPNVTHKCVSRSMRAQSSSGKVPQ